MVTPESNPQIRALAREASRKIKALTDAHNAQIEVIYTQFQEQANAVKQAEASTKSLTRSGAGSLPEQNQTIH